MRKGAQTCNVCQGTRDVPWERMKVKELISPNEKPYSRGNSYQAIFSDGS